MIIRVRSSSSFEKTPLLEILEMLPPSTDRNIIMPSLFHIDPFFPPSLSVISGRSIAVLVIVVAAIGLDFEVSSREREVIDIFICARS